MSDTSNDPLRLAATRRQLLRATGRAAGMGAALSIAPASVWGAGSPARPDARLVLVLLRGGLDGLAALPPVGDANYARARSGLALPLADKSAAPLPVSADFALHPSLVFINDELRAARATGIHAVATPYRDRSHFDAQHLLELGYARLGAGRDGWLNRALTQMPRGRGGPPGGAATDSANQSLGIAIGGPVPTILRGAAGVSSWSPDRLPDPDEDTMLRLRALYAADQRLGPQLEAALTANEIAGTAGRGRALAQYAEAAGRFLQHPDGPRVAVLEASGWDTHANQGRERGVLATRLAQLDGGLKALRMALGTTWAHTVVLVVTEFGRTVAMNGTRGTDHGTASAAFLLGGPVAGGSVLSQWPGLRRQDLHMQRDLRPTLDMRSLFAGLLHDHLGLSKRAVADVFADGALRPQPDLLRY